MLDACAVSRYSIQSNANVFLLRVFVLFLLLPIVAIQMHQSDIRWHRKRDRRDLMSVCSYAVSGPSSNEQTEKMYIVEY